MMIKNNKKVTITDIAAAAGVSKTTVSRYINGREDLMSEKTRQRIKAVIKMSNYRPSATARSLKSQRSKQIGVIISDLSSPFSTAMMLGIGNYLEQKGYTPIFANCNDSKLREEEFVSSLIAKDVEGLIVNTTSSENLFLISYACRGIPIVLCDRQIKNYKFDIVTGEYIKDMYSFVTHLKEQGYTRPAFFTQKWMHNSSRYLRRQGFIEAVEELYGYDPKDDIYLISTHDKESTPKAFANFMGKIKPGEIPAIIGVNSITTMYVLSEIKKQKLAMPSDIGLCGPEDWDWGNLMNWPNLVEPNITTIYIPAKELGEKSAEMLLKRIENRELAPQEILLPSELIVRESTKLKQ